ncbi:MAG TPA: anhydro-N-acetylmuramic acid kinase [Thermodesulfobacteriota bacterium]|nr:anhydro-N-acetylmuramic acid kinase [Thermodesulfobacteriota bacterium]
MKFLNTIISKEERLVVGLMSGTSMDGVDAVLARIKGNGLGTKVQLIEYLCIPYDSSLRARLEGVSSKGLTWEISELNFLVGEAFAQAALAVIAEAGLSVKEVDLVGSHGQTIYHNPPSSKKGIPSTMQIGELDVIAELTGLTTIGDFRPRDIAAGGEGAPLVPYVDFLLFGRPGRVTAAQNIGGISNVTVVSERIEDVIAFDSGPGNMLMDKVLSLATNGKEKYDRDGKLASRGVVDEKLLDRLLSNPFFDQPPPKSTGAELFGNEKARELYTLVEKKRISLADLMATLLALTVESIARSYERFIIPQTRVNEVILSGGGVRNPALVEGLRKRLKDIEFSTSDKYGIPVDAKEALAFAVLANELLSGNYTNLPSVTGARRPVPLGKIVLGVRNS